MKKLLYTLFAFAIIVACEKDMMDNDASSIMPIEASVDKVDTSIIFDILNGIDGLSDSLSAESNFKGNSNLTARTSSAADCHDNRPAATSGNSRLDVQFLPDASGNLGYSVIRGNSDIPLLLNRNFVRFSIPASGDISLELFVQGADGNFGAAIPLGDIGPEPGLAIIAGLPDFLDIDRVNTFFASQTPSVTEDAAAAGIACVIAPTVSWEASAPDADGVITYTHATHGTYTVQAAPFPLSGFLATTSISGSANYAGTTAASVRTAIEGDIED